MARIEKSISYRGDTVFDRDIWNQRISAYISEHTVEINSARWSGRQSHEDAVTGIGELIEFLCEVRREILKDHVEPKFKAGTFTKIRVNPNSRPVTTLEHAKAREADYDSLWEWLSKEAKSWDGVDGDLGPDDSGLRGVERTGIDPSDDEMIRTDYPEVFEMLASCKDRGITLSSIFGDEKPKSWRAEIIEEECRKDIPVVNQSAVCECAVYTGCFFEADATGYNIFTCDKHERQYLTKRGAK